MKKSNTIEHVSCAQTLLIFCVILVATFAWMVTGDESLTGPTGSMGDDVYFENIAYHLAKGEGIKFDFTDPEWQRPYREANLGHQNDWILHCKVKGLTTSRSPGFPLVAATVYRFFGRQFWLVRAVNLLLMTAAITLLLNLIFRFHGRITGTLALVTMSLDCFVLRTAGQFMTEALGTAIVCLVFAGCIWLSRPILDPNENRRRDWLGWFVVGLLFGFGALVRANLNAWLPLIVAAFIATILWQWWNQRALKGLLEYGVSFGVGVALIAAPYWVRNCLVTDAFAPFGTSGSFGLVGGYSDEAFADFGNWSNQASVDSQRTTMKKPGFLDLPLPKQELWMGKDSINLAEKWMIENWKLLPSLMTMKAISHLGFYRQPLVLQCLNGAMLFGALIGCYLTRHNLGFWVLAFFAMSLVTTCLTWPHYGRYSLPLRPLIHVACAIGTVAFWTFLLTKKKSLG